MEKDNVGITSSTFEGVSDHKKRLKQSLSCLRLSSKRRSSLSEDRGYYKTVMGSSEKDSPSRKGAKGKEVKNSLPNLKFIKEQKEMAKYLVKKQTSDHSSEDYNNWTFTKSKQVFDEVITKDTIYGKTLRHIQQAYNKEIDRLSGKIEYLNSQVLNKDETIEKEIEKNKNLRKKLERICKENYKISKDLDNLQVQTVSSNSPTSDQAIRSLENALQAEKTRNEELNDMFKTLGNLGIPVTDIYYRQKLSDTSKKKFTRKRPKMRSMFIPKMPKQLVKSYSPEG